MNQKLIQRFIDVYQKIYGIVAQVSWDGEFYRSAHLPMAMNPNRMKGHVMRLESRASG